MNPITLFMLGAFTGAIIASIVAHLVLRRMERYMSRMLDYWAGRVSELQEQVNDLEARKDSADYWRDE